MNATIIAIVVAVFLAVGGYAYKKRGDAIQAEAVAVLARRDMQTAIDASNANAATIEDLREQNRRKDTMLAALFSEVQAIKDAQISANEEREQLKGSDDAVREFLSRPVPDALRRLYH